MLSAGLGGQHPAARVEIGRTPRRDRSYSASRSVRFRLEIGGTTGARLWCVSTSETGVSVSGVMIPGGVILGTGDRMGRASPLRAGSAGARVCPRGWRVLHTRAHRVLVGTAESCGTALSVAITVLLPCAQTPLTAHGNPTTTHHAHQKSSSFQQKPASASRRPRSPMCNTNDNHTRSTHPPRPTPRSVQFRLEIGPIQPDQPNVETRTTSSGAKTTCPTSGTIDEQQTRGSTTDLNAKLDRSRHGLRPISWRKRTDLGTGSNRSRAGVRPISRRNRTDLGEGVVRG